MSTPRDHSFDELRQAAESIQEHQENEARSRRQQAEQQYRLQQSFGALDEASSDLLRETGRRNPPWLPWQPPDLTRHFPRLTDRFLDACRQFHQAGLHLHLPAVSRDKVLACWSKGSGNAAANPTLEYALKLLDLGCGGGRRQEIQRLLEQAARTRSLNAAFIWLGVILDVNEPFRIKKLLDEPEPAGPLAEQPVQATPRPAPATDTRVIRDKKREARDRWLYQRCCQRTPYKTILSELKKIAPRRGWDPLDSIQAIRTAAHRYAERQGRPPPPRRQDK